MPVRPKPAEWADETREADLIAAQDAEDQAAEGEAPALDDDDDPDALAGEEIEDPLGAEDD